ncbi:hypothetical protein JL101_034735 (plasmid) [Skermanella rosea]|uniref:hypothetical protein n=1 Tax=Skermanella rosea TaxID=1817965 RepID=UPI001931B7BE|nr:hypothetical protein [Skermanella rosea]UEM07734.1 hypothetical protein JL101_034735 [Skermanella rosea]
MMHTQMVGKFMGDIAPDQEGTDSFDCASLLASIAHQPIAVSTAIFPAVRG